MARFIQAQYPVQHAGLNRVTRGLQALGSFSATRALLHTLSVVGSPATRLAAKVSAGFGTYAAARRQRRDDDKLWNIALSDARVMADLSRAMSRDAVRDVRGYY
ncbi:MAG TPA: hypothetical protein VNB23_14440 [Ramlibacter sp.]|nr:hypothetical protein [Ramlibacter sp.]